MRLKQNGEQQRLEEIVLFPFDDFAIPFQYGVSLQLDSFKGGGGHPGSTVMGLGEENAPDDSAVTAYGTVRRVGDELWMWYCAQSNLDAEWYERVCFATSRDGRNWERPRLGLVEFNGNKNNNIVNLPGTGHTQACVVYHEPDDPDPSRRFKMSFESRKFSQRMAVAFSADGLNWNLHPGNPVGPIFEQAGGTKYNGVYFVNGQGVGLPFPKEMDKNPRRLQTHISYDFETWTQASCVGLNRDPLPPRRTTYGGSSGPQVHLGAALWNRGNTLIGFYGMWNGHPSNDRRLTWMHLGMAVSHDGLHFREPFPDFPMVSAAEIDWEKLPKGDAVVHYPALIQAQGFENIGEETLFWYSPWPEGDAKGVHLASWPRDRLGSFQAFTGPDSESYIISQPISLDGKPAKVFINADGLGGYSALVVSVLTEKLELLPGYGPEECTEIKESGFRQVVHWKNRTDISSEQPVRLRIDFTGIRPEDARLYAIYLEEVT